MTARSRPSLLEIYAARQRLAKYLTPTPLVQSYWLSSITSAHVSLKVESIQPSQSFKIRGALNAALRVVEQFGTGQALVTASAGNHGRALALAGELLGLRAIVFTPSTAPEVKKAAIRRHGAELRDAWADYDAAELAARQYADAGGGLYISPYNHPDVIAGAGTIALEILEALPNPGALVVPLGGGGLASGLGIAVKGCAPHVSMIGVEVEASTPFAVSLQAGAITAIAAKPSLADGLTGNLEPGAITFDLVRRHVDRLVRVSEPELERAVRALAAEDHLIAEGAGATATAAVLAGRVSLAGRAVVLLTGANIDSAPFASIVSGPEPAVSAKSLQKP